MSDQGRYMQQHHDMTHTVSDIPQQPGFLILLFGDTLQSKMHTSHCTAKPSLFLVTLPPPQIYLLLLTTPFFQFASLSD